MISTTADTEQKYKGKLMTPEKAVTRIASGSTVIQPLGAGEPPALLKAISEAVKAKKLQNLTMHAMLPLTNTLKTVLRDDLPAEINWESYFFSGVDRNAYRNKRATYVPNLFHQAPRLFEEFGQIDTVIATVSPMDRHGCFSLGVSVDYTLAVCRKAKQLIVEVNPNMPRVHGAGFLHIDEVDCIVEHTASLEEVEPPTFGPEEERIGQLIAEMIPNGATLQLGIGGIPSAVVKYLMDHRDLGIHTEMMSDSLMDLILAGVATGRRKTIHKHKAVISFATGTKRLYDFLDDNPMIEALPVEYVNDPAIIAGNYRQIAINAALQVDLTGQCCAESFGASQYSGTGGQLDFIRGAFDSPEGRAILAFQSTAKGGAVSRIVPTLSPGAVVTTPRTDVHYLVTEYGTAQLKGKSLRERARLIIGLAHPQFRESLEYEAKQLGLI
ncbi:MAG: acetyl-CoA hydrolase/transferase family protein [Firmicutes bacterium]|nr:acetyl-CoA hydrolase/transferase family protein [Bacillota bacterium]